MKILCRLLGHKFPGRKRAFLMNEHHRCERCGQRVLVTRR